MRNPLDVRSAFGASFLSYVIRKFGWIAVFALSASSASEGDVRRRCHAQDIEAVRIGKTGWQLRALDQQARKPKAFVLRAATL